MMETKLIKIVFIFILFPVLTFARYKMTDVSINDIKMSIAHLDYNNIFNCKILEDRQEIIEETNMLIDKITYSCDSLLVIYYDIDTKEKKYPFTYYIESFSDKYPVQLKDMKFYAGMTVEEVGLKIPSIKHDYEECVKDNEKNLHRVVCLGIPLIIETKYTEIKFQECEGLKFQILEGKVVSVIVDFRLDGDFN